VDNSGRLVLQRQRHLKWRALDGLERMLMVLCGVTLAGFSLSVCADIVTRIAGRPWLWLQEVTSTLFIYGIFIGFAAAMFSSVNSHWVTSHGQESACRQFIRHSPMRCSRLPPAWPRPR